MAENLTPPPSGTFGNAAVIAATDNLGAPIGWDPNQPAPMVVVDPESSSRVTLQLDMLSKDQLEAVSYDQLPADWAEQRTVIAARVARLADPPPVMQTPQPQRRVVSAPMPKQATGGQSQPQAQAQPQVQPQSQPSALAAPASTQASLWSTSVTPMPPATPPSAPTRDLVPRHRVLLCAEGGINVEACYHAITRQDNLLILKFDTAAEGYPRLFPARDQRYALQIVGSSECYIVRVLLHVPFTWYDETIDVCFLVIDDVIPQQGQ